MAGPITQAEGQRFLDRLNQFGQKHGKLIFFISSLLIVITVYLIGSYYWKKRRIESGLAEVSRALTSTALEESKSRYEDLPEVYARLLHALGERYYEEGKLDEARQKAFAVSRMVKALPHPDNTEFAAEEKIILEILGICRRHCHPPFRSCTDEEKEQARRVLVQNGKLPG